MFSYEHLNNLRAYEIEFYLPYFDKRQKILELGGGTGEQAKQLAARGYQIESVDLENSTYSSERVFPVKDYDGEHLPFDDDSFDVIFSSNVLEHIPHLDQFHMELKRVLKPGGYGVHIMPTGTWRFWTSIANYVELVQRLAITAYKAFPTSISPQHIYDSLMWGKNEAASLLHNYWIPPRHGEKGNVWTEIIHFSRWQWRKHFIRNGYEILEIRPLKLFYTGHMVLGSGLSMKMRNLLSHILGSACILYKVRPQECK